MADNIGLTPTAQSLLVERDRLQAEVQRLETEVGALRGTLYRIMNQVDGNIRVTVRDCVNGSNDVQDIYEYCDTIESLVMAHAAKDGAQ